MESFCSLFDPSDGVPSKSKRRPQPEQDHVKKKPEPLPKGRRRGRRAQGKNETLPEESSFLCEPDLSTELLVKDGSYFESYIEVNKKDDEKPDADKKPKRRNSGRKSRRRKKVSPGKETSLDGADTIPEPTSWNNQSTVPRVADDTIGKNVNDLHDYKRARRREQEMRDVIEKLEKVVLKDDTYLAGELTAEDLDNDLLYSSDDLDESYDDSASSGSESGAPHGSLPPEPRFGNVEYKLQLVAPCERRFQHLVTQLKWRLRSGGGSAVYVVGVRDCGALRGLRAPALRASLHTLQRMAHALHATLAHASARRVAPRRAVAEVHIRKLADTQQSVELRVAVMGANEAGKSTLIGVLTQGELDNGRGSARLNMFRHLHEVKSGRTSSLSHEILGFDAQGNVVNYGCSELMTAERIGERSAKLVAFLDLAGHSKYQRTTLHGLSGYSPHHAMLVISATAGITRITEEHIGLLLALDLPFFAVLGKCELAPAALLPLTRRLAELLAPAGKKPLLITDENMARNCVGPKKLILDTLDNRIDENEKNEESQTEQVPVFPVSCVRGYGLSALHAYLLRLQPPRRDHHDNEACEFQIDEVFHVGDSGGPVVGGLLARGRLREGDALILGPLETGEFVETTVRSIYRNRVPCGLVLAGQSASLGLAPGGSGGSPAALRAGMVLLAAPREPRPRPGAARPSFGGCAPGTCTKTEIADMMNDQSPKNRKNMRRKNKNLLQDIANAESSISKPAPAGDRAGNVFPPAPASPPPALAAPAPASPPAHECRCSEEVLLEDPADPRGCIFFQASVHVLRHQTAIYPGFQCTVHVGNVRQTAIIEGIMSRNSELRAGAAASVLFRFARCPEYLVRGRRLLLTAGLGTRAIGRVTQIFPYVP